MYRGFDVSPPSQALFRLSFNEVCKLLCRKAHEYAISFPPPEHGSRGNLLVEGLFALEEWRVLPGPSYEWKQMI